MNISGQRYSVAQARMIATHPLKPTQPLDITDNSSDISVIHDDNDSDSIMAEYTLDSSFEAQHPDKSWETISENDWSGENNNDNDESDSRVQSDTECPDHSQSTISIYTVNS